MEPDYQDIVELERWDDHVHVATTNLCKALDNERRLEILCVQRLKSFKMASSISLKAKFIEMRCQTENEVEEDAVDEWIKATYETKKAELSLRQAEGQRDSIKKKLSILPK